MIARKFMASVLAGMALGAASSLHAADADSYPNKPIRLLVPFVAGAGTDITARTIATKLTERWGQTVVADNRTGAAGTIAVDLTAKAVPDGYTICLISASHSVNAARSEERRVGKEY